MSDDLNKAIISACAAMADFAVLKPVALALERAWKASKVPVERTPETVLRAMLRAYTDAAVAAEAEVLRPGPVSDAVQLGMFKAQDAEANMRSCVATFLATGEILPWLRWRDYEARLSGARPLDAPPMEEP